MCAAKSCCGLRDNADENAVGSALMFKNRHGDLECFNGGDKKLNSELNEMWYDLNDEKLNYCADNFLFWWMKIAGGLKVLSIYSFSDLIRPPLLTFGPPPGHLFLTVYRCCLPSPSCDGGLSVLALMRWRTVDDAAADCGRGVHAAADRDCKGPWWRKCRFYPPANPWPTNNLMTDCLFIKLKSRKTDMFWWNFADFDVCCDLGACDLLGRAVRRWNYELNTAHPTTGGFGRLRAWFVGNDE